MSKRILLIDSDESFAHRLAAAANAGGFEASTATNSEQGMTLARQESPDLIVVCVEAQPHQRLHALHAAQEGRAAQGHPVILTSANATPDSFESTRS